MLPTIQGYTIFLKSVHPDFYASVRSYFLIAKQSMLLLMPKYFHYTFAGCTGFKDCLHMRRRKYSIVTCFYHIVRLTWFSGNRAGPWRTKEFYSVVGDSTNLDEERGKREGWCGGGSHLRFWRQH